KLMGIEKILSFSAVGSLRQELEPRDFVIPDQLVDRTRHRPDTFFGEGVVGHVPFADPFANGLGRIVYEQLQGLPVRSHLGGTLVCMEGPLFSTRAESELYRSWGCDLINMSALPEAKLARGAGGRSQAGPRAADLDARERRLERLVVEEGRRKDDGHVARGEHGGRVSE